MNNNNLVNEVSLRPEGGREMHQTVFLLTLATALTRASPPCHAVRLLRSPSLPSTVASSPLSALMNTKAYDAPAAAAFAALRSKSLNEETTLVPVELAFAVIASMGATR
jgi:hypothetical protein